MVQVNSKSELYQLKIWYQEVNFSSSLSSLSPSFFINSQQCLRDFDLFIELRQVQLHAYGLDGA